ncbi:MULTISPECIES: trehalose-phosphatase [Mycobacterium]|uniref:Trehalose 6-phosphate phosphatase n=1 Tax=Mycobacterium kiyosense TaxID=2871094 RepID=A0A9P3QE31_9MYCO|nr:MULTISPECIES: trehalose-phosphatase [Mycobacterium]BDB40739.1 trehalose-phosphate phosphatase [Mycobacterium kiyosense]BDE12542.1 trehalose-phosphate phosphatase [Mycobacterium sp. 20KCMC460]GLB85839.1 trehalose-phosphate phosphatase [Mycobacterium kiyosense]GLB91030.1 trehalose-phosphate phosphatase [Mycobacterium kiyosense]GLB96970.1 trehalose-phosphate phosphatase [Mycobacterium kiyosense]
MSVTIDPRRIDAVLFDAALKPTETIEERLREIRVQTAQFTSDDPALEIAEQLGVRAGRCAVVAADASGADAARAAGFALVIRVGGDSGGADAAVTDPGDIGVRTGDKRISELPDALRTLGRVSGSPAVFFDFDGTLSEIVNDPDAARPAPGVSDALQRLAARCPVAILSGRDLADVSKRVGLPGIWYAGSHGFELTAPDGTHHQNDEAAAAVPVLEQAAAELREQLGPIPGVVVEHKRFGVAVHYRNAARDRVGEVSAAVRTAGRRDALRVTTGREVIELRPDLDWDKGKTLRWVMEHLGSGKGPLVPIYLGDDITDEDAFDAVRADGVPIMVRHNDDGDRATAAEYALENPAAVAEFILRLAGQLETSSTPGSVSRT